MSAIKNLAIRVDREDGNTCNIFIEIINYILKIFIEHFHIKNA